MLNLHVTLTSTVHQTPAMLFFFSDYKEIDGHRQRSLVMLLLLLLFTFLMRICFNPLNNTAGFEGGCQENMKTCQSHVLKLFCDVCLIVRNGAEGPRGGKTCHHHRQTSVTSWLHLTQFTFLCTWQLCYHDPLRAKSAVCLFSFSVDSTLFKGDNTKGLKDMDTGCPLDAAVN